MATSELTAVTINRFIIFKLSAFVMMILGALVSRNVALTA